RREAAAPRGTARSRHGQHLARARVPDERRLVDLLAGRRSVLAKPETAIGAGPGPAGECLADLRFGAGATRQVLVDRAIEGTTGGRGIRQIDRAAVRTAPHGQGVLAVTDVRASVVRSDDRRVSVVAWPSVGASSVSELTSAVIAAR